MKTLIHLTLTPLPHPFAEEGRWLHEAWGLVEIRVDSKVLFQFQFDVTALIEKYVATKPYLLDPFPLHLLASGSCIAESRIETYAKIDADTDERIIDALEEYFSGHTLIFSGQSLPILYIGVDQHGIGQLSFQRDEAFEIHEIDLLQLIRDWDQSILGFIQDWKSNYFVVEGWNRLESTNILAVDSNNRSN